MQTTETVIVGGGQAGLALSRALTLAGHDHVILERGRIGERWRSERWDSLRLLTPNWLNVLPGASPHEDPHGYLGRAGFVGYLERYAASFGAPVVEDAGVRRVVRAAGGFRVDSEAGSWWAPHVVVATGDCAEPHLPPAAAGMPSGVTQLHATRYRSPDALPPGGVLVVGSSASGQQIALELARAGRDVILSAGRHTRAPRRYRGRDVYAWLAVMGDLSRTIDEVADPAAARRAPTPPLSGARYGEDLDLGVLRDAGVTVAGRLQWLGDGVAEFDAEGLAGEVEAADGRMARLLGRIDAHVAQHALDVPAEDAPAPVRLPAGPSATRLRAAGVRVVLWATGYRRAYPWLRIPVLDGRGEILHRHGATPVPGLHVLGMRFQHRRSSHFIGGVGSDAELLSHRLLDTPLRLEAA